MTEHTLNRIGLFGLALALLVFGVGIFFERGFYDAIYNHYFDFGPHHRVIGLLFAAGGIAIGYSAVRHSRGRNRL